MHDVSGFAELLKILVVVGIALFSFIRKLAKSSDAKPSVPQAESEEARRAREEIRRKIAERKGLPTLGTPPARTPPPTMAGRRLASPTAAPRPVSTGERTRLEEVLRERLRRREAEEAQRLEALRQAALEEIKPVEPVVVPVQVEVPVRREKARYETQTETGSLSAAALSEDLSDPEALKRAFVLNELLSPPLALRKASLTGW